VTKPDQLTSQAITAWYEAKPQDFRDHLGASLIGHSCNRYLWLTFRWAVMPKFEGRMLRLFNTGNREEVRIAEELRGIGVELYTDEDGKQITVRDFSGHFGGSVDGIGKGFPEYPEDWMVLECKTMNDKTFSKLKDWSVESQKPQHYAQMQTYMGFLGLPYSMYIAVNKNTDAVYTEVVPYHEPAFRSLLERANTIVNAKQAPLKLSEDPSYWECKFCDMYDLCHQEAAAEVNCRTCAHSTPVEGGKWRCELADKFLTSADQRKGCDQHLLIPDFVPNADPIDAGVNFIEYKHRETGETFVHGAKAMPPKQSMAQRKQAMKGQGSNNGVPFDDTIPF